MHMTWLVFLFAFLKSVTPCCHDGWMVFGESCYLFADEISVSWTEGVHFCESHYDSHMVTIESAEEELFLRDQCSRLFKESRDNWFFIGATDDEVEGVWRWYNTGHLLSDGYTNWAPGQPATGSSTNQDCAVLWGRNGYIWEDHVCELKSHVICEMPLSSEEESVIG